MLFRSMLACIHIDAMDTRLHIDRMFMRMCLRLGRYLCGHMRVNVWPCVEAMSLSQIEMDLSLYHEEVVFHAARDNMDWTHHGRV